MASSYTTAVSYVSPSQNYNSTASYTSFSNQHAISNMQDSKELFGSCIAQATPPPCKPSCPPQFYCEQSSCPPNYVRASNGLCYCNGECSESPVVKASF